MSGIAIAVDWSNPDAGEESVRRMLAAMPHRAPDGSWVAKLPHCVLGFALRATTKRERAAQQPLHDPSRGLWIVGDARIDNRDDLASALGVKVPPSDVELLLLGYEEWGEGLAEKLYGDFAFAIWNERERTLYAARDAFGMRPLFYHRGRDRLLVASEVDALLETCELGWEIEDETVADFLARNRYRDIHRTFFREVRRLPPGHFATATRDRLEERRWFVFPTVPCHTTSEAEDAAEFRRRFRKAVADRLEAEGPIVSELSGGLDSGSIACMADAIYREDPAGRPPLTLASALYPGFACDERPFIEAVHRRVRFRREAWDATVEETEEIDARPLAGPWRFGPGDATPRALRLAHDLGSRTMLTGGGGDTLLFEMGVFRDLAAHGRFVRLARETLFTRLYAATPARDLFMQGLRAAVPGTVRRAYRRVRSPPAEAPPPWLGPRLRTGWRVVPPPSYPEAAGSWTQKMTWWWLVLPTTTWQAEIAELTAARTGVQLRCPFFDRQLAEWVLVVPWLRRLPRGRMKNLLRQAMEGLLPSEIIERDAVTVFTDLLAWNVRRSQSLLAPLLAGPRWDSGAYVDRPAASALLQRVSDSGASREWESAADAWNAAMLEYWLRALDLARRRGRMAEKPLGGGSDAEVERRSDEQKPREYQPPQVEWIGSLRDLLGKSGGVSETSGPNPFKP